MRADRKAGKIEEEENSWPVAITRRLVRKLNESLMERGSKPLRARLIAACFPDPFDICEEIVEIAIRKVLNRNMKLRCDRRRLSFLIVECENDRRR